MSIEWTNAEPGINEGLLVLARRAMERMDAEHGEVMRQRDELRAILAPLMDAPYIVAAPNHGANLCAFCERAWREWHPHEPDCPVLRKDALLGRT